MGHAVLMDGIAIIALGLIAYGCLHIKTSSFEPWQWLNIIFGIATLISSVVFWYAVLLSSHTALFAHTDPGSSSQTTRRRRGS
jgi:MFS transporter, ACS family, allantoate permease